MSFLQRFLDWRRENPKKAAMLILFLCVFIYKKLKAFLRKPKSLNGKVVLVTGGASGFGKILSLKLLQKGCIVHIWDVNRNALQTINDAFQSNGNISAKFVDVTSKQSVVLAANEILEQFGNLDILVNNAGVVAGLEFLELSEKQIQRTFNVNIVAHFWTLQAFLPSMIRHKCGHIVSIISTSAHCAVPYLTDYAATKYAARGLDLGLSRELRALHKDEGIVFSAVYPHFMNTGMFAGAENSQSLESRMLTGAKMLSPGFVADETIHAIQYNVRETILPKRLGHWLYLCHLLPFRHQDYAAINSNSMTHFQGNENRLKR